MRFFGILQSVVCTIHALRLKSCCEAVGVAVKVTMTHFPTMLVVTYLRRVKKGTRENEAKKVITERVSWRTDYSWNWISKIRMYNPIWKEPKNWNTKQNRNVPHFLIFAVADAILTLAQGPHRFLSAAAPRKNTRQLGVTWGLRIWFNCAIFYVKPSHSRCSCTIACLMNYKKSNEVTKAIFLIHYRL